MTDQLMRVAEAVRSHILAKSGLIVGEALRTQKYDPREILERIIDLIGQIDNAAIVASVMAESGQQEPVAYLCADLETGKVVWSEGCVCEDPIFDDEVNNPGCFSLPVYTHPQPAIRPGYKLVPIEPTDDMLVAARDWSIRKNGMGVGNDQATGCYQAMIAAAPEPKGE